MDMKRPRVMAVYRDGRPQEPSAATDEHILSLARQGRGLPASPAPMRLALAAALIFAAVFAARWMMPVSTPAPEITYTGFGLQEGRTRAWLATYQPTLTDTGPGSREGLTP